MSKKKVQKALAMLLVAVMMFTVAGCGKKFDAVAYVKASMDLVTKHDVGQYTKVTGASKEDAEKVYQDGLGELDQMTDMMGTAGLPEDLNDSYIEFIKKVLEKTKYTVKEAKEEDGNINVTVEVEPIKVFDGIQEELTQSMNTYLTQMQEDVTNGAEVPSEEEIMRDVYNMMLELLNAKLENAEYAEKKTVTATIKKDSDGDYEIDETSFIELGASLIDYEGVADGLDLTE